MRLPAVAALAAALLVALSGCEARGPLLVRKVLVDVEPVAASEGIDREQVRAIAHDVLGRARGLKIVEAARGDAAAVLRVRVESFGVKEKDNKKVSSLSLSVEVMTPAEPGGYRGHAVASAAGIEDVQLLIEQGLRDALAQVLMTRSAADLDSKTLLTWITDPDGNDEQKRRAIRVLGSRRERSAVEPLTRVLLGRDPELAQLALVALTNIGDPGAVDAVIRYSDRQPGPVRKQCIEAVKAMGGSPKGLAWLFVMASGHPDVDVQQQAQAALNALETKGEAGAAVAEKLDEKPAASATP